MNKICIAAAIIFVFSTFPAAAATHKCSLPSLRSCTRNADCDAVSICMAFDNPCVMSPETVRFCVNRQMTDEGRCTLYEENDGSQSVRCKQPPPPK